MRLRWGEREDNDLGWWGLFVVVVLMVVAFILKVLGKI